MKNENEKYHKECIEKMVNDAIGAVTYNMETAHYYLKFLVCYDKERSTINIICLDNFSTLVIRDVSNIEDFVNKSLFENIKLLSKEFIIQACQNTSVNFLKKDILFHDTDIELLKCFEDIKKEYFIKHMLKYPDNDKYDKFFYNLNYSMNDGPLP